MVGSQGNNISPVGPGGGSLGYGWRGILHVFLIEEFLNGGEGVLEVGGRVLQVLWSLFDQFPVPSVPGESGVVPVIWLWMTLVTWCGSGSQGPLVVEGFLFR